MERYSAGAPYASSIGIMPKLCTASQHDTATLHTNSLTLTTKNCSPWVSDTRICIDKDTAAVRFSLTGLPEECVHRNQQHHCFAAIETQFCLNTVKETVLTIMILPGMTGNTETINASICVTSQTVSKSP